jgi:hypothetical protein
MNTLFNKIKLFLTRGNAFFTVTYKPLQNGFVDRSYNDRVFKIVASDKFRTIGKICYGYDFTKGDLYIFDHSIVNINPVSKTVLKSLNLI